jgi:hypothetical protein
VSVSLFLYLRLSAFIGGYVSLASAILYWVGIGGRRHVFGQQSFLELF